MTLLRRLWRRPNRRALAAAVVVLVVGVLASTAAGSYAGSLGERRAQDVLDRRAGIAAWALQGEVARYHDAITTLAASVGAQQDFGAADFEAITAPLLQTRLNGAASVAFIVAAQPDEVADVSAFWQARGSAAFQPDGSGEHLFLALSESLDGGQVTTVGRDLSGLSEPTSALQDARRTGRTTVSDDYVLLRDRSLPADQQHPSFVMVTPVLGAPGTDQAQVFRGWVLLAMRAGDLAQGTLTDAAQGLINVRLTVPNAAGQPVPAAVVHNGSTSTATRPREIDVPVAQHTWTLTIEGTSAGDELAASYTRLEQALRYGGMVFSVLLAALVWTLVSGRRRAEQRVAEATVELRAAEATARRQAELLDAVVDSIGDGIGVVDADGTFVLRNRAAVALLGKDADPAVGAALLEPSGWQRHFGMFRADGVTRFPREELPLVRALHGEGCDAVDMVIRHPDRDADRIITVAARPLVEAAGVTRGGAVAVFHDVTQARLLEQQLAAQHQVQQRLLTALSDLGEAVTIMQGGRLVYVNQAYGDMLGHDPQDLVGVRAAELCVDESGVRDATALAVRLTEPGASGGPISLRLRHRDGGAVSVEVVATAVEHEGGLQTVCLLRDVTAQLRDRAEVARSEAVFQAAFDDALVGMCLVSLEGRFVRVNAVLAGMLGRTPEECLTLYAAEINHPDDDAATSRELIRATLAGERDGFRLTKRYLRADGTVRHAELSSAMIRDADGAPQHFANQIVDITDRVHAELQRDAQQRMLRTVMDNTQSLIYVKDLGGRYLLANALLQRAMGRGEAEIVGRTDHELHIQVDPEWAARDRRAQLGPDRDEDRISRADGSVTIYESVRFPLHDVDGLLYGTCGISLDVTARRQVTAEKEAAAQAVAEAALEATQAKSRFLATMSHEIRTPLNGVLGLLALLQKTELDSQQQSWTRAADSSGRALLSIVNDVLDSAKIEAGAVELEQVELDLVTVVDEALAPLRPAAEAKGLSLVTTVARGFHPQRFGDPTRLRQVVTNLVANAVRFTERGSVTVMLSGEGMRVGLTVADTGLGMDAEQRDRLFVPFTQAEASITRRFGGTGLGLSIVLGLVEQMDGTITVVSTPGLGSSFVVDVPLVPIQQVRSAPALSRRPAVPPPAPGTRLLVAEDNEVNQLVARATLEAHGLIVDVVSDGAAAVAAVASGSYTAVFMDCRMPGVDGLEATRLIRAAERAAGRARMPIIAMTASAFDTDRKACLDAGMDGFLPKPWTPEQLADSLRWLADPIAGAGFPTVEPAVPSGEPALVAVRRRLDELLEGLDPEDADHMRRRLLESFLERAPAFVRQLTDAGARQDTGQLTQLAHSLRGMAGNLGADAIAGLAAAVEAAPDSADVPALVARLGHAVTELVSQLLPDLAVDDLRR